MSTRLNAIIATFALAIVAIACSPAAAQPSVAPTIALTPAPTVAPTASPTQPAEVSPVPEAVLDFDEIGVENLANIFIDKGWFSGREDSVLESGDNLILLHGTKSGVTLGIIHDGNDNLIRVTALDGDLFASDESRFDLGIINGVLLKETLGTEAVNWETSLTAEVGGAGIDQSKVFGPNRVTVNAGTDAQNPKDAFVYFQDAS